MTNRFYVEAPWRHPVAFMMAICFAGQSVPSRRYCAHGMEPAMIAGGLSIFVLVSLFCTLVPVTNANMTGSD